MICRLLKTHIRPLTKIKIRILTSLHAESQPIKYLDIISKLKRILFMYVWFWSTFAIQFKSIIFVLFPQVPREFNFPQTVDLFFKIHHTLNLEFDERIQNMFFFLQYYVYEMNIGNKKPFTKMIDLWNLLQ